MQPVDIDIQDHIAHVRFGDPAQRNVLTVPLLEALVQALERVTESDGRVAVLRGRGDTWSAGYDVGAIPADIFADEPDVVAAHPFERCMAAVRDCPLPLVAAVQGDVFGGALELAASCDLVVAHAQTRFGLTPARLGLVYSHTGLRTLLRRVGSAHARMLVFTAESVEADEAARMGLANEVVPAAEFEARVEARARQIAASAPLSVRGMKRILRLLERGHDLNEAELRDILALRQRSYASDDFREGQAAFREKRPPRFRGT